MPNTPTNWAKNSHPDDAGFVKAAVAAGKRGDPDPSKSDPTVAACFFEHLNVGLDQLHHQAGFFIKAIEPDRLVLAAHGHIEDALRVKGELTENEERRYTMVLEARERIASTFDHHKTEVHSIVAAWFRVNHAMREGFRRHYPYANHISALDFPVLDPTEIKYGDDSAGFSMTSLTPAKPFGDQPSAAVVKAVLSQ